MNRRVRKVFGFKPESTFGLERNPQLIAFGLMQSLTAIPADFHRMFQSPWTIPHAFFVTIPVLLYFSVIPGCGRSLLALGVSRPAVRLFLLLGYLPLADFLLYGVAKKSPGLVQRLLIIIVHACSAWLGWVLIRISKESTGRGVRV